MSQCESCAYYVFDEDFDEYVCEADMDEDDYGRLLTEGAAACRYYRDGDEYKVVCLQVGHEGGDHVVVQPCVTVGLRNDKGEYRNIS